ncbi:MAG: DUF86 domain-containing protein [Lachnospiraceae bacterium]|nr:DUF86 domain-containing protein [Lachnospiraceae bacterium]
MDNKKILKKIIKYIDKIILYVNDTNYSNFIKDEKLQDACLMNLSQIGESIVEIEDSFINEHKEIKWKEMKGMRNIIVHDYDGVNLRIVWDTIKYDLPELRDNLYKLL